MKGKKKYTPRWLKREFPKLLREELRRRARSPDELPSHELINDIGHQSVHRAIKREFDMTTHEFLVEVCGFNDERREAGWPGDSPRTISAIESYLRNKKIIGDNIQSTVDTEASKLRTLLRYYLDITGHGDLLHAACGDRTEGFETIQQLFVRLKEHHDSVASRLSYAQTLSRFFSYCVSSGRADFDPAGELLETVNWTPEHGTVLALSAEQVRRLFAAADSFNSEEKRRTRKVLIVMYAGAGARSNDLQELDARRDIQFGDSVIIKYRIRKNGPGTAVLMAGRIILQNHLAKLRQDPEWNGRLFPSNRSETGSRTPNTLRRWFKELVEIAGITIDGTKPTPINCRKFWYSEYSRAGLQMLPLVEQVTDEQGSESADVVLNSYLSDEVGAAYFRAIARESFLRAFPENLVTKPPELPLADGLDFDEFREEYAKREEESEPHLDLGQSRLQRFFGTKDQGMFTPGLLDVARRVQRLIDSKRLTRITRL